MSLRINPSSIDGLAAGASLKRPAPARRTIGLATVVMLAIAAALLGFIALEISLPVAGVLYCFLFVGLTVLRPDLAFLIIFLEAPLVWDLGGGPVKLAMADVSLMLAAPVLVIRFLMSGRSIAANPLFWPIVAYFLVCLGSTVANGAIEDSLTSMFQMLLYMGLTLFMYSNCVDNPRYLVTALYGLLITDAFLSIMVLVTRSNYVLDLHKNAVGSELDYAVVIAVELWLAQSGRKQGKWFIGFLLLVVGAGLVCSLSRGGWLGSIVGVILLLFLHKRIKLAIRAIFILAPVIACCWFLLPQQSKDYATDFGKDARNIQARYASLDYAANLFERNPVFGLGVGLRKDYDATNVIMSTLAETGVLGLITFLSIFAAMFWMVAKTCRLADQGSPIFSLSAISGALMAAKFAHGCVDHYWSRVMLPVWAAAGMGVYCYNVVRRQQTTRLVSPARR